MTNQQISALPQKVDLAVKLLYGVVAIGVVRMIINIINHIEVRSIGMTHLIHALTFVLSSYFIYQLSKQQNWARITLLIILIVEIPFSILPMFDAIKHSLLNNGLGLIQAMLFVTAMILLYRPESSAWFNNKAVAE
ncbi:MAG: hypothetical protein AB9Q18_09595 [Candidatus Reddybacter sp.]